MDEETKFLLANWGLSEYIPVFTDAEINSVRLRQLAETDLSSLFGSSIGCKVQFRENWRLWKANLESLNSSNNQLDTLLDISSSILRVSEQNPRSSSTPIPSYQPSVDAASFFQPSSAPAPASYEPSTAPAPASYQLSAVPAPTSYQPSASPASQPSASQFFESRSSRTFINVRNVLQQSFEGQNLLRKGSDSTPLDIESKKSLSSCLINSILDKDPDVNLTSKQFMNIGVQITEVFPAEFLSIYYTESQPKTLYQSKKNQSGYLLSAYKKKKQALIKSGVLEPRDRSRSRSSSTPASRPTSPPPDEIPNALSPENVLAVTDDDSTDIKEMLRWIESNVEPWRTARDYWQKTAAFRLTRIRKDPVKYAKLVDYFNTYKPLLEPHGYTLLLDDFAYLYPSESQGDPLRSTLFSIANIIIGIAENLVAKKKEVWSPMLKGFLDQIGDQLEARETISLVLLSLITNVPQIRIKSGQRWKPSWLEVRDGFIFQVATEWGVEAAIEGQRQKLSALKRPLQPFVVYVGDSIVTPTAVFVVVDGVMYRFNSVLTAVDVTFRIIHAIHAEYPEQSRDLWLVIQKGIYNIHTEYDKKPSTGVTEMLSQLGLLRDSQ